MVAVGAPLLVSVMTPLDALMTPTTSSLWSGVVLPMATLPVVSAIRTVPLSSISSDGIPEMSLTLNIVPVRVSVMEKSCPDVPSKLRVPSSRTRRVTLLLSFPVNLIVGSPV